MKRLLLCVVTFGFFSAQAQQANPDAERFRNDPLYRDSLVSLFRDDRKPGIATIRPSRPLLVQKGKPGGVVALPQDNMPCIVPDTKDIAKIPNIWSGKIRSPFKAPSPKIPNPTPQTPQTESTK
jgi:hypothetical protein